MGTRWAESNNMEEELDRLERLRAQEIAQSKTDKRKTRTHTQVQRPDRDEGDDEEIHYGIVRYYMKPEDIVVGGAVHPKNEEEGGHSARGHGGGHGGGRRNSVGGRQTEQALAPSPRFGKAAKGDEHKHHHHHHKDEHHHHHHHKEGDKKHHHHEHGEDKGHGKA